MSHLLGFLLIAAAFAVVRAGHGHRHGEDFEMNMKECHEAFPADDEAMKAMHMGQFPEDETLKCFVKCMLEKNGMIDKDGVVQVPEKDARNGKLVEMVAKCKDMVVADCQAAYDLKKCVFQGKGNKSGE